MTSYQRMSDHSKRGTFPFKMLFHSSRYDFRFPRYRRVKKKVIFNRLLSLSLTLTRISRSHLGLLTYPKLQTSDRRDSWKNVVRVSTKKCRSLRLIHNFLSRALILTPYISQLIEISG